MVSSSTLLMKMIRSECAQQLQSATLEKLVSRPLFRGLEEDGTSLTQGCCAHSTCIIPKLLSKMEYMIKWCSG